MQSIVAHQAWPLRGRGVFAGRQLQPPGQRAPVKADDAVGLAAPDRHREAMHLRRHFERLDPLDAHPCRILARQVVELGAILAPDRLGACFFAASPRIALRQRERAAHGLAVQVVMVGMQPFLVAAKPAAQALDERSQRQLQSRRQCLRHEPEHPRPIPDRGQIGIVRRRRNHRHPRRAKGRREPSAVAANIASDSSAPVARLAPRCRMKSRLSSETAEARKSSSR